MTEQMAVAPIEQVQITLLGTDTPAERAQKSWHILGGQGPVNPTFEKIFEVYQLLDQEELKKGAASEEPPVLMAG